MLPHPECSTADKQFFEGETLARLMFTLGCVRCCYKHCGWAITARTWKEKEKLIARGDIRRSSTLLSENGEFYGLPPPVWLVIGRAAVHHVLGSFPAVWHYWHAPIITHFCLHFWLTCLKCSFRQLLGRQEAGACVTVRWEYLYNKQDSSFHASLLQFSSFTGITLELAKPTRGSLSLGIKLPRESFLIQQFWVK